MGRSVFQLLNGKQELGRGPVFWAAFAVLVAAAVALPFFLGRYAILNLNSFLLMSFMVAGLSFIWGYVGILSLGQSAFFGVGGYAYGVVGINLEAQAFGPGLALVAGLCVTVALALGLGWLMFYGRLRGVYVAIITLVVALLFETFLNQTAGPQWVIGGAHLGGNNGLGRFSGAIEELPSLGIAALGCDFSGGSHAFYYLMLALTILCYIVLRGLVNSPFGLALAAIQEDPDRTESLGYDVRLLQTVAFAIGAGLAALSGILYVSWGTFITPSVFGVTSNVLPVVWVAVSDRKSIGASIVGALVLQLGSQALAMQGELAFVIQGLLLVLAVLVVPDGIVSLAEIVRPRPLLRRMAGAPIAVPNRGSQAHP